MMSVMYEYRTIEVDVRQDGQTRLNATLREMADQEWRFHSAPAVSTVSGNAKVFLIFERERT
jgi:hypothetical protein